MMHTPDSHIGNYLHQFYPRITKFFLYEVFNVMTTIFMHFIIEYFNFCFVY